MFKRSSLNGIMLLFSLLAAMFVYVLGELLLAFMWWMPFILQCGIYLTFVSALCFLAIYLSEKVSSGYYIPRGRVTFEGTCAKAAAILIPMAFALGFLTQLVYGFLFAEARHEEIMGYQGQVSGAIVELIEGIDLEGDDLEIVFVVDTTGSMGPYINDVKNDIIDVLDAISGQTENFRVALIDYRDFPSRSGVMDYPGKLQLDFTNDTYAIADAVNALTIGWGGDKPETMYYALIMAVELDWRATSRYAIVLADAPPLDPEPYTGNTLSSVAVALEYMEIELMLVGTGGHPLMISAFEEIAEYTGGVFVNVEPAWHGGGVAPVLVVQELITWWERPHLLLGFDGAGEPTILSIIFQAFLLSLWGIFTGIATVVFLNNNKLFGSFLIPRIIVSIVMATTFAVLLSVAGFGMGMPLRGLLAVATCVLYLPTYSWGHDAVRY